MASEDIIRQRMAEMTPLWEEERLYTPAQWLERWRDCYPSTYPPELYWARFRTYCERGGLFRQPREITVWYAACRRCGEDITTGHMCKDIREYAQALEEKP
jgi:hypothetical protein